MYRNKVLTLVILQVCAFFTCCFAQKGDKVGIGLQTQVYSAISKAYNATVLMWEIDAATGNRMSAQFSGVVVTEQGTILSAAHVVGTGKTYKVMFANGKECTAKGSGRITIPPNFMVPDAAMLKIEQSGAWPYAPMGWSSALKVGQPCISIAYPESVEQRKPNVRYGKIRVLQNEYGFIESSCIMEPGDSGGPLFDLHGRVIGIHSGIQVPEDVNYEIPVDTYRKYWSALNKVQDHKALPETIDEVGQDNINADSNGSTLIAEHQALLNKTYGSLKGFVVKINSTVDGKEQSILGAMVSTEGLKLKKSIANNQVLVSKSSMVGQNPAVVVDGKTIKATILARDRKNDLVLLLLPKTIGKGISTTVVTTDTFLGTFLLSPSVDTTYRTGVLSATDFKLANKSSVGFLGAGPALKGDKLILNVVPPGGAAEAAGLKEGDIIDAISGVTVEDELDFVKALKKYAAEDTIIMTGSRAGNKFTKTVVLKYPPIRLSNHPVDHFVGGKSIRRDGFEKVAIQDAVVKPAECGGPVFDMFGNFVGVNIARLSRTNTVIMPKTAIMQFLQKALN